MRDRWNLERTALTALVIGLLGVVAFSCSERILPTNTDAGTTDDVQRQKDGGRNERALPPADSGRDAPYGSCTSNQQCGSGRYCHFASGCGKTGPGVCKFLPRGCHELYAPVCGCDNKTYDNDCHAYSAGVSVASKGECKTTQQQCQAINQAHIAAVKKNKDCCPTCKYTHCPAAVKNDLACPCSTYVQTTTGLAALEQQWKSLSCTNMIWPCPGVPCPAVTHAVCTPTGSPSSGTCVDKY